MLPQNTKKLHFIGIGGCGMSGIAWILQQQGFKITGSDLKPNRMTHRLEAGGAKIALGHHAENITDQDVVVISTAIKTTNAELQAAIEKNITIIHRADALAHIMENGRAVAIAGTHGKTTTTSMLSLVAERCELDPTVLIGGELNDIGGNSKIGTSSWVIAESDESDGSFLKYHPELSIVTNVEADHLDYYKNDKAVIDAFRQFISQTQKQGRAILCLDDPNICNFLADLQAPVLTYSIKSPEAEFYACDIGWENSGLAYTLHIRGQEIGRVQLSVPGEHNVLNSLAVLAASEIMGADMQKAINALQEFKGAVRRFQIKGESHGVVIVDDYAHHPTEIRATLGSAQNFWASRHGRRIVSIFQPHRYSRTQHFSDQFGQSFANSEEVIITDVYSAGESPIDGIDGRLIYDKIKKTGHKNVNYIASKDDVMDFLTPRIAQGDLIMTLGAGDIWQVGEQLLDFLNEKTPA